MAVVMIQRLLHQGCYRKTVQYETVQKFQSAAFNVYLSSIDGQGDVVLEKETQKFQVTKCPIYSDFFERFNKGLHKRMGDVIRPDRAISHLLMLVLMESVERDWETAREIDKLFSALEGTYSVLAFTQASRGEEVP